MSQMCASAEDRLRTAPRPLPFARLPALAAVLFLSVAIVSPLRADDAPPGAAADAPPATQPTTRPAEDHADAYAAKIGKWWSELSDRDPAVREAARTGLMGLSPQDLPVLRKWVVDTRPAMPAQAVVLREIVTQVFLSGDTYATDGREGFLGVRPGEVNMTIRPPGNAAPNPEQPGIDPDAVYGVAILERMPGFCGARSLQDGDIILGIVERPSAQFRNPSEFSTAVRLMGPGQLLHFQVLRQGQVIRIPITLSARPEAAEFIPGGPRTMDQLLEDRERKAKEYWEAEFAPLLKEGIG